MSYSVVISEDAEDDLFEIVDYVFSKEKALAPGLAVQERIEKAVASLATNPQRGRIVRSLRYVGVRKFRELIENPWRIVFSIQDRKVHVVAIVDGRRSADDLLRERQIRDIHGK